MSSSLNIAIAGLGTVGCGVVDILQQKPELLAARAGTPITITAVSARDKTRDRGCDLSAYAWCDDPLELATREDVDVVVELIGGADGTALALAEATIKNKKAFVTANKALIATHGMALATAAERNATPLAFEAAVAGGIPIIKTIKEALTGNQIRRVLGIMNGTCNYILTAMQQDQRDFDDVLREAQELGYAEADPSFDINGTDTAHKLAILTSLAFATPVNLDAVYIEGIEQITLPDILYAHELGYHIRLLGIAALTDHGIEQRVHPVLVPLHSPLARVEGVLNAVEVDCDALGPIFLEGAGAGAGPTASAVVADIVDIAAGRLSPPLGLPTAALKEEPIADIARHHGPYYLRLVVQDTPGVLSAITTALSEQQIGVKNALQPSAEKNADSATIILVTHATDEHAMQTALAAINKLNYVLEAPHMIRIEG